jgi:hypothetical protein
LPDLYEVTLIDISEHGALLGPKKNVRIGIGDQTRLRLLTQKGNQAFEVDAFVWHRSEEGIGLEFYSIDQHAKSSLRRLIEMNLGTLELASRSLPNLLRQNFLASATSSIGA